MALGALSGSYADSMKSVQKQRTDINVQMQGAINMNVTEVAATARTSRSNQSSAEQEKGNGNNAPSDQHIRDAITRANGKLKAHRTRCEFSYHEETKRVSIKVFDKDTEEVIREIPPEEALEMLEKIWELAGLLVDEKR